MHPVVEELRLADNPAPMVSKYLFDGVPAIFSDDAEAWLEWRTNLAEGLGVDPHSVLIVGSAAYGVSMSPYKEFKEFGQQSDVDVAVVCARHFDTAWFELRNLRTSPKFLGLPRAIRNDIVKFVPMSIFFANILTTRVLGRLSFGKKWAESLAAGEAAAAIDGRAVGVRLYRDAEALRAYQERSLRLAKQEFLEKDSA